MNVRTVSRGDLPAIARIYNDAIETSTATFDLHPLGVEERDSWFAQFEGGDFPLLVCEAGGGVVGFAYYVPYRAKPAYAATVESTVYVDATARSLGVGRALYAELIELARTRGVHTVLAVVADHNEASEALHKSFGFEPVGCLREVGRKFGRWIDTTFWQLTLPDAGAH